MTTTTAGSVRQLPDGRWQAGIPLGYGRGARRQTRTVATRREAQAWLQAAQAGNEALGTTAGKTIRQAFALYIETRGLGAGTARTFTNALAQLDAAGLADVRLRNVKPSMLERYATHCLKVVSANTARLYVAKLVAVLKFARRDGALSFDPKSPTIRVQREQRPALDVDQVRSLYEAAPENVRALIVLQAFTGMRISEASAITVADVDTTHGVIKVTKQVAEDGSLVETKNRKSRAVPVAPEVIAMLPLAGKLPGAYLATNAFGDVLRPGTSGDWFRGVARAAGVEATSHELRKFYVTTNLGAGVNPATVAAYIGDTVKVMLEVYALVQPSDAELSRGALGVVAAGFAA